MRFEVRLKCYGAVSVTDGQCKSVPNCWRNGVPLFWYATSVLSASPSQQISVDGMARIAKVCRADNLVDEAGMLCSTRWRLERNAASDGKPMQITKEFNGVLLTCGSIADDLRKPVLDYL